MCDSTYHALDKFRQFHALALLSAHLPANNVEEDNRLRVRHHAGPVRLEPNLPLVLLLTAFVGPRVPDKPIINGMGVNPFICWIRDVFFNQHLL